MITARYPFGPDPNCVFDVYGQVRTRSLVRTRHFAVGTVFVDKLTLLHRSQHGGDLASASKPPDRETVIHARASTTHSSGEV
jgi:hypothetical protein